MTESLKIKVCGLKDANNMAEIDKLGVDYLGMIFYEKSPRYADNNEASFTHTQAKKVGVFVNASIEYIEQIKEKFNIQVAQLHGSESPQFSEQVKGLGLEVWKVFGVDDNFDFAILDDYDAIDLFLFDTKSPLHGGTGIKFNWEKLNELNNKHKFMLSGGIGKDDAESIKNLRLKNLVAIDLNSKFETAPGQKDIKLLNKFIDQLRNP